MATCEQEKRAARNCAHQLSHRRRKLYKSQLSLSLKLCCGGDILSCTLRACVFCPPPSCSDGVYPVHIYISVEVLRRRFLKLEFNKRENCEALLYTMGVSNGSRRSDKVYNVIIFQYALHTLLTQLLART